MFFDLLDVPSGIEPTFNAWARRRIRVTPQDALRWNLSVFGSSPLLEVVTEPPDALATTYEAVLAVAREVGQPWWQKEQQEPRLEVQRRPAYQHWPSICTGVCCLPSKPMFGGMDVGFRDPLMLVGDQHISYIENNPAALEASFQRIRDLIRKQGTKVVMLSDVIDTTKSKGRQMRGLGRLIASDLERDVFGLERP